ncbi:MAG TPA: polyprenyl synthetase family protein [Thermomicrobiaceae bacterium]|nr:polyprenyl synthetase family protein [Thermomicrobiaceae bacterium]
MNQPIPPTRIAEIIEDALAGCGFSSTLREWLALPLRQPGKLLAGSSRWPLLVLAAAESAGGGRSAAERVAAAVEIFMAGVDVLDEIEDADPSPLVAAAGMPQALNAGAALLMLGQQVLADVVNDGVPPDRAYRLQRELLDAALRAAGGQHLDLAAEGASVTSSDEAFQVVQLKAGALVAGACCLGALLGTDDVTVLALYEEWGRHWGAAAQLENDLRDATEESGKRDREREKGTLPLVYAREAPEASGEDLPPDALVGSDALGFTQLVIEVERQRAAMALDALTARGQDVAALRELMG